MKRYRFYILILSVCLVSSCEKMEINLVEDLSNEIITFTTDIAESRGEMLTTANFENFGVYSVKSNENLFLNREVYKNKDGYWEYYNTETWENDSQTIQFQAYAPYNTTENGITPIFSDGSISVEYIVPSICVDQPDLMLAKKASFYNSAVALEFVHTLASVEFKIKGFSSSVKIISIEFMGNIAVSGTVTLDSNNSPQWSSIVVSESASYFVNIDEDHFLNPTTANTVITDDGYLMMIPNSYGEEEIRMNVVLEDSGVKEEITYLFSEGITWQAGVIYTYTLERDINGISLDYTSYDDSNCYMLHPYTRVTQNIYIPISNRINDFWQNYSGVADFTEVTAATVLSAEVLWYDTNLDSYTKNSISEIGFNAQCTTEGYANTQCAKALKITLPDGLTDGNVVVGVKDEEGNMLWSWHFWITSYNPDTNPVKLQDVYDGGEYVYIATNGYVHKYYGTMWGDNGAYSNSYMMGRNIGEWVSMGDETEVARGVLYQFGRKDPFLAPSSDRVNYEVAEGTASFADAVTNPTTYYTAASGDWCTESLGVGYLWNDKDIANSSTTGKSIFDPSPLGWRLPVNGTWSDFPETGIVGYYYNPDNINNFILYGSRGSYSSTDGVFGLDEYAYVWSATAAGADTGYNLRVGSNSAATLGSYRSQGYYVRPIKEY